MKRTLAFAIVFILFTLSAFSQDQKSEQYYRTYILTNYNASDPLVGIYTAGGYVDKFAQGKHVQHEVIPSSGKFAIIRKESCFVVINLSKREPDSNDCDITPTTSQFVFIDLNGNKMTLSDGVLKRCKDESNETIAKFVGGSVADVIKLGIQFTSCTEFTKVFPTQWDIDNFKPSN